MRALLILTIIFCALAGNSQKEAQIIKDVMMKQQQCWSNADIDGFMQYYWKSDSMRFIGSKGITYGWKKTLDNYKKSYPDAEKMGELAFDILNIEVLSQRAVYVIGKWNLKRKENSIGGYYTLLWKKIKGNWVIVADHTS